MNILHLLVGGNIGGIEILCKDYAQKSRHKNIFAFFWAGGPIVQEIKELGVETIEINAKKQDVIETCRKLLRVCEEKKVEVAIVHHASPLLHFYLIILKKYARVKTIAYAHGNARTMCRDNEKFGLALRKSVLKFSLEKADCVVAISDSVKKSLIEYMGIDNDKISVIYNGVDINRFYCKQKRNGFDLEEIIFVGRLVEGKGVQVTLRALAILKDKINYRFRIVGDGPYREELERLIDELHLKDRVELLGNRRDIPQLLESADIFIHMPFEEGFGITIVEAMASGLICICADVGAASEIIDNGVNGYIVDNNENMLAQVLLKVYSMTNRQMDIIREAAIHKANTFSIYSFVNMLDSIIESLYASD